MTICRRSWSNGRAMAMVCHTARPACAFADSITVLITTTKEAAQHEGIEARRVEKRALRLIEFWPRPSYGAGHQRICCRFESGSSDANLMLVLQHRERYGATNFESSLGSAPGFDLRFDRRNQAPWKRRVPRDFWRSRSCRERRPETMKKCGAGFQPAPHACCGQVGNLPTLFWRSYGKRNNHQGHAPGIAL